MPSSGGNHTARGVKGVAADCCGVIMAQSSPETTGTAAGGQSVHPLPAPRKIADTPPGYGWSSSEELRTLQHRQERQEPAIRHTGLQNDGNFCERVTTDAELKCQRSKFTAWNLCPAHLHKYSWTWELLQGTNRSSISDLTGSSSISRSTVRWQNKKNSEYLKM